MMRGGSTSRVYQLVIVGLLVVIFVLSLPTVDKVVYKCGKGRGPCDFDGLAYAKSLKPVKTVCGLQDYTLECDLVQVSSKDNIMAHQKTLKKGVRLLMR
jgi:hypothetical protein